MREKEVVWLAVSRALSCLLRAVLVDRRAVAHDSVLTDAHSTDITTRYFKHRVQQQVLLIKEWRMLMTISVCVTHHDCSKASGSSLLLESKLRYCSQSIFREYQLDLRRTDKDKSPRLAQLTSLPHP